MSAKWKPLAGLALVILSIAAMYMWESRWRGRMMLSSVLVFSQDVAYGEIIGPEHFKNIDITPGSMIEGALKSGDEQTLYGLEAAVSVRENQQVLPEYFKTAVPLPEGYASFVIERDWICSQSILDEVDDTVALYLVEGGKYLGSYRIRVLSEAGISDLEIACSLQDYLVIRGAALAKGEGSIVIVNEAYK